eukprot:2041524-Pyramimonas_sp.AAC.1
MSGGLGDRLRMHRLGCCVVLGHRIHESHVKSIVDAPSTMLGRSGEVRIKSGSFDFIVLSVYPPPVDPSGTRRAAQQKAAKAVMNFFRGLVSRARE